MSKWYFVTSYSVTNPDGYAEYPKLVGPTQAGLARRMIAGPGEVIEGEPRDRTVVLEFESREKFDEWYYSDEYQKILPLRADNSEGWAILIEEFSG
ncbi:MAG: DUF1330 domain-containing protein [Acidimicrobiia bacterium]|nr:DUF1330 domain-containing protein [Acidimicrobiia bacterium]